MKALRTLCSFIVLIVISGGSFHLNAQVMPSDSILARAFQTDEMLPMLIDSAIKYAGMVNRASNAMELWKENEKIDKKSFLNGISFVSSYNYGTTGDLSIGSESGSLSQFSNFRSSKSDRYNIGLNVQLPLGNLLSRKNNIKISQLQAKMMEGEKENAIQFVKQEVIRLYQDLKLAQRLVITGGQGKQAAFVNYSMAEKQFLQAAGDLEQLSRLHDIYTKSALEFETYVNRFQTNFMLLEAYTNTSFFKLLQKIK